MLAPAPHHAHPIYGLFGQRTSKACAEKSHSIAPLHPAPRDLVRDFFGATGTRVCDVTPIEYDDVPNLRQTPGYARLISHDSAVHYRVLWGSSPWSLLLTLGGMKILLVGFNVFDKLSAFR
jgi:hypothetical protein